MRLLEADVCEFSRILPRPLYAARSLSNTSPHRMLYSQPKHWLDIVCLKIFRHTYLAAWPLGKGMTTSSVHLRAYVSLDDLYMLERNSVNSAYKASHYEMIPLNRQSLQSKPGIPTLGVSHIQPDDAVMPLPSISRAGRNNRPLHNAASLYMNTLDLRSTPTHSVSHLVINHTLC